MKTASFPWSAREGKVFDPKEINENFRKGAQYLRDSLALRYTYSMMRIDLTGINCASDEFRNRIIPFYPFGISPMDIVGGELITSNFAAGEKLHVKWIKTPLPAGTPRLPITTSGSFPFTDTDIVLPNGGPTEDWRYIEVEALDGKILNSNTQQRNVRIGDTVPIGVYCLEVGSDTGCNISPALGMSAELVLWLRSSRGTNPEFNMPELFNGQDAADANKFNAVCTDLETHRAATVDPANQDTWRLDCFAVRDVPDSIEALEIAMGRATIPSPNDSSPNAEFRLARVDYYVSTDAAQFSPPATAREIDGFAVLTGALATFNNPTELDGPNPGDIATHVLRVGDTIAAPLVSGPALDAMDVGDDSFFGVSDANTVAGMGRIKTLYVYLWYRLST
jgi:hypothetical protein